MASLPTALAFTVALNLLLVAKFLYPEWLGYGLVRMAGWVAVGLWGYLVLRGVIELPVLLNPRQASGRPDRFGEAHLACLRADWMQAEALLAECLGIEPRDPPALLMLSAVYRRTGRLEASERLIEDIRLTEAADRWWLEIEAEQQRLRRDRQRLAEHSGGGVASTAAVPDAESSAAPSSASADEVSRGSAAPVGTLNAAEVDAVVCLDADQRAA